VFNCGYSMDRGEFREQWRSVAVPVRDAAGEVIAAVSCGGNVRFMNESHLREVRDEMLLAVAEFSRQLGNNDE
jgi:DNA-binding IclR family transcriptional regulator